MFRVTNSKYTTLLCSLVQDKIAPLPLGEDTECPSCSEENQKKTQESGCAICIEGATAEGV